MIKILKHRSTLGAFVFYILLTMFFTYPLVFKFNSEIPAGGGDTYQAIAQMESRSEVLRANGLAQGIFQLAKQEQLNTFLPYAILHLFFNKFTAYNIMFFLSFSLSGLGTYLLALYFIKNKKASFLAGMIFSFAPFHVYQAVAVHAGTMHQQWIPFFILFLFKFFEEFRFRYFILTGMFFFFILLSEHQLTAFTVLFFIPFLIYKLIKDWEFLKNKKFWVYVVASAILFGIASFMLFGSMFKVAVSSQNFLDSGIKSARKYAMKPLEPIAPPANHSLWSNFNKDAQKFILGKERKRGSYFLGYLSIVSLLLLLARSFRGVNTGPKKTGMIFWVSVTLMFYIFSLGPEIKIAEEKFKLPYYLVYAYLPFYENIRTTGRIFVLAMLGISILSAWSLSFALNRYGPKKSWLALAFAIIIMLEFSILPMKTMSIAYSSFYEKLGQDPEKYKILEIPGSTDYEFASFVMITDTIHKKEPLNGMPLARVIKGQFDFQRKTPVIKQLLYTLPDGHDPEKNKTPEYFKNANEILNTQNVQYITISKKFLKEVRIERTKNFIDKYIGYEDKYEDEYLVAYKIGRIKQE